MRRKRSVMIRTNIVETYQSEIQPHERIIHVSNRQTECRTLNLKKKIATVQSAFSFSQKLLHWKKISH